VAAAWLGHSTLVAQKHCWQVTDEDFERAPHLRSSNAPQRPENDQSAGASATATPAPAHKKPQFFWGLRPVATLC